MVGRFVTTPRVQQRNTGMFRRFYTEPERYSTQVARYDELFRALRMVKTFTDGGYEVRIYAVARG
jgi:hypothetical protein